MLKPFLIFQLRPEDDTSDNEFAAILKYAGLEEQNVHRIRIEKGGIPDNLSLDNYSGLIVGGSPYDISTPQAEKSAMQMKIEQDFNRLFDDIVANDFPFLGNLQFLTALKNIGWMTWSFPRNLISSSAYPINPASL